MFAYVPESVAGAVTGAALWLVDAARQLWLAAAPYAATSQRAARRLLLSGARDCYVWDDGVAVDADTTAAPAVGAGEPALWYYSAERHEVAAMSQSAERGVAVVHDGPRARWPWIACELVVGDAVTDLSEWTGSLRVVPPPPPRLPAPFPAALLTLHAHATGGLHRGATLRVTKADGEQVALPGCLVTDADVAAWRATVEPRRRGLGPRVAL
jgi:hypothetical protein